MIEKTLTEIDILIRARYSILYLITHEENRLQKLLAELAEKQNKKCFAWTATTGIKDLNQDDENTGPSSFNDPAEVLNYILESKDSAIFILKDFHPFLEDPQIIRSLRDVEFQLRGTYKTLIITSPTLNLPTELEKSVTIVDVPLPDNNEIFDLLMSISESINKTNPGVIQLSQLEARDLAAAAQGLTLTEAENVFSKAIVNDRQLNKDDIRLVIEEKKQIIRKSGILQYYPSRGDLGDVGGLNELKSWLNSRSKAFTAKAKEFGIPVPKGVLLLGAPGCGKSLTAKVIGNVWKMPLLRLDFGSIFSGLVGSSEENMRKALKTAESVAPVVLWIDEIEKGLSGSTSGQGDSGTSTRVFGTFLTWMQENESQAFVIATANQIDQLPPELLRRGRFDEIFFLDLPTIDAREEIYKVILKKKNQKFADIDLVKVAELSDGFSGSEIEHTISEAMYFAFNEERSITTADIELAIKKTVPLSVTYSEPLEKLRTWAKNRARPAHIYNADESKKANRASKIEL